MYNNAFDQWFKNSKQMSATTETYQRLWQQNLEMMSEQFARVSDQLSQLSEVKKPEDLFAWQKNCMNANMTAAAENMQKYLHATSGYAEEMTNSFSPSQERASSKYQEKSTK